MYTLGASTLLKCVEHIWIWAGNFDGFVVSVRVRKGLEENCGGVGISGVVIEIP